ncbi:MAG TPA: dipeptidase PepE [Gemmatimonadales bacterium]|nr:dipeptidase PepE [Gemmatimonadales bacterium]
MRLLLLSNSTLPGEPYLAWPRDLIAGFLATGVRRVAFVPFAGVRLGWDAYTFRVQEALAPLGLEVVPVVGAGGAGVLAECEAVLVGGGNTFQLVAELHRTGLLEAIGARVRGGMPYVGWSAGAVVACPTIRTTNDMPIVEPPSFRALGLVPFQLNAHYTEAVLPNHGGETRQERLAEFLALNPDVTVLGLREGSGLRLEGTHLTLVGTHPLTLFTHDAAPRELAPGAVLDDLILPAHA